MFQSSRFLWGHSVIVQQEKPGPRDGVAVTSHYLPLGSLRLETAIASVRVLPLYGRM